MPSPHPLGSRELQGYVSDRNVVWKGRGIYVCSKLNLMVQQSNWEGGKATSSWGPLRS